MLQLYIYTDRYISYSLSDRQAAATTNIDSEIEFMKYTERSYRRRRCCGCVSRRSGRGTANPALSVREIRERLYCLPPSLRARTHTTAATHTRARCRRRTAVVSFSAGSRRRSTSRESASPVRTASSASAVVRGFRCIGESIARLSATIQLDFGCLRGWSSAAVHAARAATAGK